MGWRGRGEPVRNLCRQTLLTRQIRTCIERMAPLRARIVTPVEPPIDITQVIEDFRIWFVDRKITRTFAQRTRLVELAIEIIGPAQAIDDRVVLLSEIEAAPQQAIALL